MKQHRLTSERTKTPADDKPNVLDTTAIREPVLSLQGGDAVGSWYLMEMLQARGAAKVQVRSGLRAVILGFQSVYRS
jgi:hypothetical protein